MLENPPQPHPPPLSAGAASVVVGGDVATCGGVEGGAVSSTLIAKLSTPSLDSAVSKAPFLSAGQNTRQFYTEDCARKHAK